MPSLLWSNAKVVVVPSSKGNSKGPNDKFRSTLGMFIIWVTPGGTNLFDVMLPIGLRSAALCCQCTTNLLTYIARNHGIAVENYLDDFMGAEVWEKAGLLPAFGFCHCWVWCSWSPGQSLSSNLWCHLSETCPSPLLLAINFDLNNDLDIGFDIFKFKFWNICNRLIDLKQKGYELIIWCLPCVDFIHWLYPRIWPLIFKLKFWNDFYLSYVTCWWL